MTPIEKEAEEYASVKLGLAPGLDKDNAKFSFKRGAECLREELKSDTVKLLDPQGNLNECILLDDLEYYFREPTK